MVRVLSYGKSRWRICWWINIITVDMHTKPMTMLIEDWEMLDRKEKSTIWLCILDSVLLNLSREASEKVLWDKLGTLYQSKSLVNKMFLQKNMYNLRMKVGVSFQL